MDNIDNIRKIADLLHSPEVHLTVLFDTVKIEITCKSDYEAQVLLNDMAERFAAGQEISIKPGALVTGVNTTEGEADAT